MGQDAKMQSFMRWTAMRTPIVIAVKISLASALIWWIIERGGLDWSDFRILVQPVPFLVLAGLVLAQIWVANLRWQVLLVGQGLIGSSSRSARGSSLNPEPKTSHWSLQALTLPLSLIGLFFNYAVPGSVGGDFVKAYYLTRKVPERKLDASVSVLVDRLIGFFVMLASGAVAFYWFQPQLAGDPRIETIGVLTAFGAVGFLGVLLVAFSARARKMLTRFGLGRILSLLPFREALSRLYHSLHSYRKRPKAVLMAMGLSAINQVLLVLFFAYIGTLQSESISSFGVYWFCIPVGLVVMSVPIAPAGVGVGQAAFFFLFEAYLGRPTTLGSTGITALQVMQFLYGLIGAFFYLRQGMIRVNQSQTQEEVRG